MANDCNEKFSRTSKCYVLKTSESVQGDPCIKKPKQYRVSSIFHIFISGLINYS